MMTDHFIVHIHRIAKVAGVNVAPIRGLLADGFKIPVLMQVGLGVLLLVQLVVIIVLYLNIIKRQKAEKLLAINEEQLKLVIDGSQQAYWDLRLDRNQTTMISPGFFEMLGYLPGEVANTVESWEALIHPDDRLAVDAALQDHYQGITPFYQDEHRFRAKTGEWRWIMGRGKVVKSAEDGSPLRVAGTYTDVSDRHRFDETIRSLVQVTSAVTGDEFFNCLVTELVSLMQMHYAHIGYLVGADHDAIRTVSVCIDGKIVDNFEYKFDGFPCEKPLEGNLYICTAGVQELFPKDMGLRRMDAQCYIGVPLLNRDGAVIGLITLIDNRPLERRDFVEKLLYIFAGRAAVELEQMQYKKALDDSERRWQFALEVTGEGVWDWDLATNMVSYSKAFKKMLGYHESEFTNRIESWKTRIHPEDLSYVMSELERHLRGEIDSIDFEYRMRCKDGQYKWVLGRGKVIQRADNGAAGRLIGMQTDITQRKISEQVLHETMVKYQSLFSSMSEGFALSQLIVDEHNQPIDYLILDVNPTFTSLVDMPRDRLIGGLGSELFGKPEPTALAIYAQVALTGDPDHVDTFFKATQKYLSITIFSPEKGKFASVFTDVTEQKKAEAALLKERNLLRTLIDNIPDAIYIKDLDYRKTLTNKADIANSGATAEEEVLGKTDFEVWPAELAERFYEHDRYVIENQLPLIKEELTTLLDQPPRWILSAKLPLFEADGKMAGLLGIGRDITDSKRAVIEIQRLNADLEQRVYERTSQLEVVVKESEAFSYSVSHDLRAPLRTINGFSSALMEDYGPILDETGRGYLARIQTAASRMSQLIDDLLNLSRISRSDIHRVQVNLSEIAVAITAELQADQPTRLVSWMICPEMVATADANLMRIVFENLLGNAWKFSSKHEHTQIEVNFYTKEGCPVYFVRDDGAGFDMAYATKLFGPFQRMHGSGEFEGSGIGLATVQRIIRRHGGEIWAESSVDQGTTIYFTLN